METVAITAEMLEPISTGVNSNLAVIVPVGIAIFAAVLGVKLIPTVIKWFVKG